MRSSATSSWSPGARTAGTTTGFPTPPAAPACPSARPGLRSAGHGTVYSYTVSHRGPGAFDAEVPYAIVLGQLAEQPRPMLVLGNLVNFPVDQISIGMPIRISYLDVPDEDVTLWQWQAAG
jgi:uncharacterized OB-fold protein